MKNREIIVPVSQEAKLRLDYNISEDNDLIILVLKEKEYNNLEKVEFFDKLNIALELMIDDYEDEEILEDKLDLLKIFMDEFVQKNPEKPILKELNELFKIAYKKRTGIFFFF